MLIETREMGRKVMHLKRDPVGPLDVNMSISDLIMSTFDCYHARLSAISQALGLSIDGRGSARAPSEREPSPAKSTILFTPPCLTQPPLPPHPKISS